jgi:hypothetical protein
MDQLVSESKDIIGQIVTLVMPKTRVEYINLEKDMP